MSSAKILESKRQYKNYLDACTNLQSDEYVDALRSFLHPSAAMSVVQPINTVNGRDEFEARVVRPMAESFRYLHRRADMLLGGEYKGETWVVSHGHYVGEFVEDWMGIPASNGIVWLHYVEYHRMDDGQAIQTYLYLDIADLLRQVGLPLLEKSIGYEGFVPGPATGDGVVLTQQDADQTAISLKLVDDMLAELWTDNQGWRPYWHPNMYWYGPSGYGSQIGMAGFEQFQLPYEAMFKPGSFSGEFQKSGIADLDNKVKGHFTRFGDGNYVVSAGWPSHGGVMAKDWLGVKCNARMFTVRVADIWRRNGNLLVENWVFVDIIDMLHQFGVRVFDDNGSYIVPAG